MDKVFSLLNTRNSTYKLPQRSKTSNMPTFLKTCKVLKYLTFCCSDVSSGWNVPETVVDYSLIS